MYGDEFKRVLPFKVREQVCSDKKVHTVGEKQF